MNDQIENDIEKKPASSVRDASVPPQSVPLNVEDQRIKTIRENMPLIIVMIGFMVFTGFLFIQKLVAYINLQKEANKHTDTLIGYEIVGPNGWSRTVSQDGLHVRFSKPRTAPGRDVRIELFIDPGNPYGDDPAAYLWYEVLPRLRYAAKIKGMQVPKELEQPFYVHKGSVRWATVRLFYDYPDIKAVYVAMHRGYVFKLMLIARGRPDRKDWKLFERTLTRFRFLNVDPTTGSSSRVPLKPLKSHDAFLFEQP